MQTTSYLRRVTLNRDNIDSFDEYPFNIPIIREMDSLEFHPKVTFFVGENGSGKSTLIEAIAILMGFGSEGGTRNVRVKTTNDISSLYKFLKPVKSFNTPNDHYFLRAESFFNVATYMNEIGYLGGYGNKSLHARSHGEAFMTTLTEKLQGQGFYVFDEPEAALSPTRQMVAVSVIHQLVLKNSQFIIATHSPILLSYPNAKIFQLNATGITETSYEDTEHYAVTKDYLNNHEKMLKILLGEE